MTEHAFPADQTTLGFTVIALGLALEETLNALAGKNGNAAGPWLDELEDLALLRARGALTERLSAEQEASAMNSALEIAKVIFTKIRSDLSGADRGQ